MRDFKWYKGGNEQGDPGYYLEFNYGYDVIERLKKAIPPYLRSWDADKKRWWVSDLCEEQVNDIFPGFTEAVKSQMRLF